MRRNPDDWSRRAVLRGLGLAAVGCAAGPWLARADLIPPPASPFRVIDLTGSSYRQIGQQLGEALRDDIAAVLGELEASFDRCRSAVESHLGTQLSGFREATEARFPELIEELEGMADGCGVPFRELFAWNCRSEIQALNCAAGCSTVGLADSGGFTLAHNEDGNEAYLGRMVVVRVTPPSGVRFAYMVYPGTLVGNAPGLNSAGICQTTNFISSTVVGAGIPRYFVGRAICEASSLDDAQVRATVEGRAFPWHHNVGSLTDGRLLSIETWPGRADVTEVAGVHLHTNHLTHAAMQSLPEDRSYFGRSTGPRMEALQRLVAAKAPKDRDDLLVLLADRSGSPCKVCRNPGDTVPGVTVGTAVFTSGKAEMELLETSPCFGRSQTVTV